MKNIIQHKSNRFLNGYHILGNDSVKTNSNAIISVVCGFKYNIFNSHGAYEELFTLNNKITLDVMTNINEIKYEL